MAFTEGWDKGTPLSETNSRMETPELDRLEECVKRAFTRIDTLEEERKRLAAANTDLETRLKERMTAKPVVPKDGDGAHLPAAKLKELKTRLTSLISKIEDLESKL